MDTTKLDKICKIWGDCQRCNLHKTRNQIVFWCGHPQARLVIIGEAPGEMENRRGKPFIGQAGELFDELCAKATIRNISPEPWNVCIMNVVGCRPPKNRKPTINEFLACEARLYAMITAVNPQVLLLLGGTALMMLTGESRVMKLAGHVIDVEFEWKRRMRSYKAIPTLHPGFLLRNRDKKITAAVVSHIRAAWEMAQPGGWVEGD